jgi:hypothetical protein
MVPKIKAYYEGIPLTTAEGSSIEDMRLSVALKSSKDLIVLALVLV